MSAVGARRKASNDLCAEQGLRGKDNNTTTFPEAGYDSTTFTLIIRTCGRNHPAPSDRSCCSWPSHAGRKEGNAGPTGSGSKEGGTRAEVQSARAYNDMQHLTTGNASPSERAAELQVIPAELEQGCPNCASVYWQQNSPCGPSRIFVNYHPCQVPQ